MTNARDLPENRLCAFVADLKAEALSSSCRERLACALLDWFTAGQAGAGSPEASRLQSFAGTVHGSNGTAPVFGCHDLKAPAAAAFANSAISHLREVDDGHRGAMMHPGIVVIPPVMALATGRPVSYGTVAAAIVAGYEVGLRTGEALGQGHYGLFHTTATAGALASAAASGIVLGLGPEHLRHALGLAATQAAGLWQFADDGALEAKVLHPAFAVRNGMAAAYAAQAGFPGASAWMTGPRGLYRSLHGDGPIEALDEGLGGKFKIEEAGTKAWPVCGQIFTALDAAQHLLNTVHPAADEIEAVDVGIYPQALRVATVDWPTTPAEVSFSLRFCLATLLTTGHLDPADTAAPALDSTRLKAFGGRIRVNGEAEYAADFPKRRTCTVSLRLRGGRTVSETRLFRRGDPEDPLGWSDLLARAPLFAPTVSAESLRIIADWCRSFAKPDRSGVCIPPASMFRSPDASIARANSGDKKGILQC